MEGIRTPVMSMRIAVLVLACASPPYDQTIEAIRRTWGGRSVPDLDIYYLYGNPHDDEARRVLSRYVGGSAPVVRDDTISEIGDVLIAGCADHLREQEDCLLRKRLIAFAHLAAGDRYDLNRTATADDPGPRLRTMRRGNGALCGRPAAGPSARAERLPLPFPQRAGGRHDAVPPALLHVM